MTRPKTLLPLALSVLGFGCHHHAAPVATAGTTTYAPSREYAEPVDPTLACEAVQRDRGIPVACTTRYIEGVPSMIIGFPGGSSGEAWIRPVLDAVAVPFCESSINAGQTALVFFTFRSDEVGRGYNCRTGDFSPWFSTASDDYRVSSY